MSDLRFFLGLARPDRWWLRLGAALAALTLLAGIGLLSLSGWFITASAVAGLAGAGRAFNYLFASGGVRGFALGRTVGRYAERMVTHEATFRILARLRLWVFDTVAPLAPARLGRRAARPSLSLPPPPPACQSLGGGTFRYTQNMLAESGRGRKCTCCAPLGCRAVAAAQGEAEIRRKTLFR